MPIDRTCCNVGQPKPFKEAIACSDLHRVEQSGDRSSKVSPLFVVGGFGGVADGSVVAVAAAVVGVEVRQQRSEIRTRRFEI